MTELKVVPIQLVLRFLKNGAWLAVLRNMIKKPVKLALANIRNAVPTFRTDISKLKLAQTTDAKIDGAEK